MHLTVINIISCSAVKYNSGMFYSNLPHSCIAVHDDNALRYILRAVYRPGNVFLVQYILGMRL